VVFFENVFGLLDKIPDDLAGRRNVDLILETLTDLGYLCGYDKQTSLNWMLPQSRQRVYVWGAAKPLLCSGNHKIFSTEVRGQTAGHNACLCLADCLA